MTSQIAATGQMPANLSFADWQDIQRQIAPYKEVDASAMQQEAYLKASNTDPYDSFGRSVAVSGNTVVVGAPDEDSAATGVDGDQSDNSAQNAGAVFVFVRDGEGAWSQQAYLKSFDPALRFGFSVGISGDTIVVGSGSDAAYVFQRSGEIWSEQALLQASNDDANVDGFGWSVDISGNVIVVGALFEDSAATGVNGDQSDNSALNSGAAYVFRRSGEIWSQEAYLKASNTDGSTIDHPGDNFGFSVAVSGDTIVVGAWLEASGANGVNGDQSDNSAYGAGAAYIFARSAGIWSQQAYLKASSSGISDYFGEAVAVSGDTIVVTASGENSAATGVNGDDSDNSAPGAGAAYVFIRSGATWSQQAYLKASNSAAIDRFGDSADISGDTIVVGALLEDSNATGVNGDQSNNAADSSGAAYVFIRNGATWSQHAYLKASNTDGSNGSGFGDWFGHAVGVSDATVVVGAYYEDSSAMSINGNQVDNSAEDAGAAYVFGSEPPPELDYQVVLPVVIREP